jgi:CheY-like chemotaxis protein
MDIQLPRMNGYEATRLIRELPHGGSIPIVAMTAHAMKGDEEKCLEVGMDGYISKPVNQDRLFHTLWRLLRSRRRAADGTTPEDDAVSLVVQADAVAIPPARHSRASSTSDGNGPILPPKLPGIDIGRALETMNIEGSALKQIMVGFLADNRETLKKIKQAHADDDPERMRQLAHGLRGSAGNIGAAELNLTAHALETACHENVTAQGAPSALDDLIDALESALNRVLESIQSLEASGPSDADGPISTGTEQALDTLLSRLADAIDQADPEQIMETLPAVKQQAARCGHIDPFSVKTLEDQVHRYDYDQALETIRRISGNLRGGS